jgi:DNA modification methylase
VRLFCGDCLDVLPTLPAGSVDLVLCDPPYGQTQNPWDSEIDLDRLWPELWRVCRGAVVLTAIQPFATTLIGSQMRHFRHEWVWEKNKASGHLNAKKMPMRAHELVLVFGKRPPIYRPQMTQGHEPGHYAKRTRFTPNYGAQRSTEYGGATSRYPRSVQRFPIVNNDDPIKTHPTQKPVCLMSYFADTYCAPGGVILDYAMGSGTTGVAAMNTGRDFVGIEKDATYFATAEQRVYEAYECALMGEAA